MSKTTNEPSITLQTIALAIRLIEKEISEFSEINHQKRVTPEYDIRMYDLDRAARNLEDVYKYIINRDQIINFSKYEDLVNRKKSP